MPRPASGLPRLTGLAVGLRAAGSAGGLVRPSAAPPDAARTAPRQPQPTAQHERHRHQSAQAAPQFRPRARGAAATRSCHIHRATVAKNPHHPQVAIAVSGGGSPAAPQGHPPCRLTPTRLLDEQDLRVLRQRPEVVGDDLLQLVGDRRAPRPSPGSSCPRMYLACSSRSVVWAGSPPGWPTPAPGSRRPESLISSAVSDASSPSCAASSTARWRAAAGSSIVLAIATAVSASMLSLVMYCSRNTS